MGDQVKTDTPLRYEWSCILTGAIGRQRLGMGLAEVAEATRLKLAEGDGCSHALMNQQAKEPAIA